MNLDLKEIFLPLSGFKGSDILSEKYRVSNYGKIYDILNHRFMKLSLCGEPQYHYVTLTHKDVRKTLRVHRLVAMSFIDNPHKLPIVDHIDRDRFNNYVGNLRWVTRSKNQINSDRVDRGKINYLINSCEDFVKYFNNTREYNRKRNRLKCLKEKINYKLKHEYISKADLCRKYHISIADINSIVEIKSFKRKKPKIKFCDVELLCLKRKVREKYLAGEHSRKKLGKAFGVSSGTIDRYVKGLPTKRRETLTKEQRLEIYNLYKSGVRQCEIVKMYGISRYMVRNIKNKKVDF